MGTQTNLKNFTGFFLVLINFFALTSVCDSDEQEITEVLIIGSNADCRLLGIYLLIGKQHGDHTTSIDHAAPDSTSHEIYKGVLDDNARGVFQGKILVRKDSQRTNGYQLNQALLLSKGTEVDSKPELEIYADDVKCSHGSTSGSIDENSIHYLMTRGITLPIAKKLLINGFLNEIFENIQEEKLKTFLEKSIMEQVDGI